MATWSEQLGVKLKLLRTVHGLTLENIASLTGISSRGNVSTIEKGNRYIAAETLYIYSELFIVSLDWLAGRTGKPYCEELIHQKEILIIDNFPNYKKIFKSLSLQTRANIVFLYTYNYANLCSSLNSDEKLNDTIVKLLDNTNDQSEKYLLLHKLVSVNLLENNKDFQDLLSGKRKTPIYDVEAAIKKAKI